MAQNVKDQVDLDELIFTQSWEDPASDEKAINIQPGDRIMSITSGGCNTLGFLRFNPEIIYAVDINPVQSAVMHLKMAAMRALTHAEFLCFLGLEGSPNRLKVYADLRKNMPPEAAAFWDERPKIVEAGFLGKGKWEAYTRKSGGMMRMLQGRRLVRGLFEEKPEEAQVKYFDKHWNTWRLRLAFKLLYSKRRLAKRGLQDDYFTFDDGSKSFAENFYNRHRNVMRNVPLIGNYFVALYLMGRYRNLEEVPEYLNPEHYETIKSRLDRIEVITADAKAWLEAQPASTIDGFALSNICELMSSSDTLRTFVGVHHAGKAGARMCFRNLMVPRTVPEELRSRIVRDAAQSKELIATDRSFVYARVDAMEVKK